METVLIKPGVGVSSVGIHSRQLWCGNHTWASCSGDLVYSMSFFHIKMPTAVLLTCMTMVNAVRKYWTSLTWELSNTKNIIINPIPWNLPKLRSMESKELSSQEERNP